VIVGAEGVELARKMEELDRLIRDANTDLRAKREALGTDLPQGTTLEDYLSWQPVADIEAQIEKKIEDLDNRRRAAARADEIQEKGLLAKVEIPSLPTEFAAVLRKSLTEVVADAETKVRDQIERHQMGHQGESWLSQGLNYVREALCPFCGQDVSVNDLIVAYGAYFSAEYGALKKEVAELRQLIDDAIGETSLASVQQAIAGNAALAEFWRQFVTIELPNLSFPDIQTKYAALREKCVALARRKQDNPSELVEPDSDFLSASAAVTVLYDIVAKYNVAVDACNEGINKQKAAVQDHGQLSSLQEELELLLVKKRRFESEVCQECQAYQEAVNDKTGLDSAKQFIRQKLDEHCETIMGTYEKSINDYLDQFNAGFRITKTRHLYTGGTPSAQYQVEINNTAVSLGDTRTEPGTPCFRTTLSTGDRGALALAFFLAVLKQDTEMAYKIIVFDDPFSSLDRFRRTCTQQLIQQSLATSQQVIVLSHDPQFLRLLSDGCAPATGALVKCCGNSLSAWLFHR